MFGLAAGLAAHSFCYSPRPPGQGRGAREEADHLRRQPRRRASRLLRRPDRSEVPRPCAGHGARREAGRRVPHRRERAADPALARLRGRKASRGAHPERREVREAPPRRLGAPRPDRGPGSGRDRGGAPLPVGRHGDLQHPRPRSQAGVHGGVQPVAGRVLRAPPRPARGARAGRGADPRRGDPRARGNPGPGVQGRDAPGASRRRGLLRPDVRRALRRRRGPRACREASTS